MDLAGVDADMLKSLFECIDKNDRKEVEEFLAENVEFPALEATAQFPPTARVMEKSGKTVLDRIREEEAKGKSRKSKTEFPAPPITERTKGGITPLFYAVAKGSVESVRGLLSFGARRSGPSIQGITPLMLAAMNGQAEIIRVLLFETPTRLPQDVAEVTEIAVRSASTLEVEDVTKEEEEGSIENDKDEVRDVDGERNRKKDRPASPGVSSKGSAVVIAVGKIEPLVSIDAVDDEGNTALMHAVIGGHLECASLLLDAGADVNCADKKGVTLYMHAMVQENEELVAMLLARGCRMEKKFMGMVSLNDGTRGIVMNHAGNPRMNEVLPIRSEPNTARGGKPRSSTTPSDVALSFDSHFSITPRSLAKAAGKEHLVTVYDKLEGERDY